MALILYETDGDGFVQLASPPSNTIPAIAQINLNILIELRLMNIYLAAMTTGIVTDDPIALRQDIVLDGVAGYGV